VITPAVRDRVGAFVADLARSPVAPHVLGVVLSGSAARGEEIWRDGQLYGDIDLMILIRHTDPRRTADVERVMAPHRAAGIDGGPVPIGPLARHHTLAFHEARANGVVVHGEVDLARLIPAGDPAALPPWEAVRVLANRLVEHVKLAEGRTPANRVAAKSYEALAEAYLVGERRYRPSYRARLEEIVRRPPDAPADVVAGMVAALRNRLDGGPDLHDTEAARAHLLDGLATAASRYTGKSGPAGQQLAWLARRERHWSHRLYWLARSLRRGRLCGLDVDPIIGVWQRTAALVTTGSTVDERRRLLDDWRACPQILEAR
jgi:hypothetical protein